MNDKKSRTTGLGTNAFFNRAAQTPREEPIEEQAIEELQMPPAAPPPAKSTPAKRPTRRVEAADNPPTPEAAEEGKIKTTVNLYPRTMAALEDLKVQARRRGRRKTYSDLLDEAILLLAEREGIVVGE